MRAIVEGPVALAVLGRGSFGVAFLAGGVATLVLGLRSDATFWFLAAVAIPGAAAGFVGAVVWASGDLSLR